MREFTREKYSFVFVDFILLHMIDIFSSKNLKKKIAGATGSASCFTFNEIKLSASLNYVRIARLSDKRPFSRSTFN